MNQSLFLSMRRNCGDFWSPTWQQAAYDAAPDATPAWNTMLSSMSGSDASGRLIPGKGVYAFKSKPNPIPLCMLLDGDGPSWDGTVFIKGYSDTSIGNENGMVGFAPGGGMGARVSGILMKAQAGTTGGCLLGATSRIGAGNSFMAFRDLYLTSDPPEGGVSLIDYAINIDGTLQSFGAQGIREPAFDNIIAFGGKWGAVRLAGVESPNWNGGALYPGSVGDGRMIVTGTAGVHSATPMIRLNSMTGLTLSYCDGGRFDIGAFGGAISTDAFVNDVTIWANRPIDTLVCDGNWVGSFINGRAA